MCGIAGFVGAGESADLHRMTTAIRHRGRMLKDTGLIKNAASFSAIGA
jgi:asparagine synthetase B (glutamine-hydrolysing)